MRSDALSVIAASTSRGSEEANSAGFVSCAWTKATTADREISPSASALRVAGMRSSALAVRRR